METNKAETKLRVITPEEAKEILSKSNINNRRIRLRYVDWLAKLIVEGQWMVTHQGIAFDKNGRLVDGQHRLLAISKSGKDTPILVTTNLEEESYNHIDIGAIRNRADIYKIRPPFSAFMASLARATRGGSDKFNNEEIINIIEKTGSIFDELVNTVKVKIFTSGSVLAALIYHYHRPSNPIVKKYVKSLYFNLKAFNYSELPPVGQAFHKSLVKRQGINIKASVLLAEFLYVLDPANQDATRVKECRELVYDDFKIWVSELTKE